MRLKTSALCVTRDRPEFSSWLAWNLNKQTRRADEVIVVDSGETRMDLSEFPGNTRIIYPDRGLFPSDARQVAQDAATGDVILWYDDDDWYPQDKNALLTEPLENNPALKAVELHPAWWFDLRTGLMERQHTRIPGRKVKRAGLIYYQPTKYIPVLPVLATRREVAQAHPWPEDVKQGSDVTWMEQVVDSLSPGELLTVVRKPSIIILVHDKNVFQNQRPQKSFRFQASEDQEWADLPREEWLETLGRMRELQG